jgi:hypothetical protein
MGMPERWTLLVAVLFIQACSPGRPPEPKSQSETTVFDPLTQPLNKARGVQSTVDQNAANTQRAIDAQERGDSPN